jgi:hypothetical protein
MRILGFGLVLMIAFAVLGIDVGASLRSGSITDGSALAKHHHRRHHRHHKRRHHPRHAPATEM